MRGFSEIQSAYIYFSGPAASGGGASRIENALGALNSKLISSNNSRDIEAKTLA